MYQYTDANNGGKHILPASTKPDAGNHGFGIANVRDTAQKYGGLLYLEHVLPRYLPSQNPVLLGTMEL